MDDPVEVHSGFPAWAVLVLVAVALVGVFIGAGNGDPVGYAAGEEAKAKVGIAQAEAQVDITSLITQLQRDIATMQAENERLRLVLEDNARRDDRAASDRLWSMAFFSVALLAAGVWSIVLFVLGANLVGDGKKRKRKG